MSTLFANKKLYKHDCDDCIYLGSNELMDFYFCEKKSISGQVSLIIRLSNNPSDYYSMPVDIAEQGLASEEIKDSVFETCYKLYREYLN